MANICPDPGFDSAPVSWTAVSPSLVVGLYGDPQGVIGWVRYRSSVAATPGDIYREDLPLSTGTTYAVSLYVRDKTPGPGDIHIYVDKGDGAWVSLGTVKADADTANGVRKSVGTFKAVGATGRIKFNHDEPYVESVGWYVDDVVVEDVRVITATIKAALLADLADIDGTGIFATTLAGTGGEPKRVDEAKTPGAYLQSAGGDSDIATLTNRKGAVEQTYTVDLIVSSDTPNADMDTLLDDVRNAVERSTSNLHGVSGVQQVVTPSWSEVYTDPDIAANLAFRSVDVMVEYFYTRGSA